MTGNIDWILKRRSIRKYTEGDIEQEKLLTILKAAMAAPSAANKKPWHFVIITDNHNLQTLSEIIDRGKMLKDAKMAIAVCGDTDLALTTGGESYWVQDCAAAMENLLLATSSLGLGAVWLGVFPNQEREGRVAKQLGLPENIRPLGLAAIGYPAEEKTAHDSYLGERVHYERFARKKD